MWSRYSQIWNEYDANDTAVYVAFYKRIPVHVTLQKTVVGSEEDKDVPFTFTATYSEHSTNIEYTVTHTYTQTREWSRQWYVVTYGSWSAGNWSDPVLSSVSTNVTGRQLGVDTNLFDQLRSPETVVLKDGQRYPFTIFYDRADPMISSTESTNDGKGPNDSGSGASGRSYTQTRTITEVVIYNAAYRYETVTIQEEGNPSYVLSAIGPDPLSQSAGHSGQADLGQRTYTISSLRDIQHGANNPGYYDYTPLDTTVFTNTRKTGSLTVTKTVVDGDEGDEFPFTVTLGETVVGKGTYTPPAGANIGPYGKVFTFTLANGGSMTLPGLPAGASYKVEEGAHTKYVATIPANATGTVEADTTITVGVTNTRKTDLVIEMNERTVSLTGEEQFGYDISSVTGTGSPVVTEAYTVTGLKEGHVLVVEHHVTSHGTDVGEYTGHFENARYTILDADGNDVTEEYLVTPPVADKLTIMGTPIVIEVTGNTATETYDGTEHVCQGYTYVVKNAVTGEVIENNIIYVTVESQYQHAFQKDVGTTMMHLAGHVNVSTTRDGFMLQGITVVREGSMEITPAPVTVTADSFEKLVGAADPTLTATVEGVIPGDPAIVYALSRAPGEEMGEYAITVSGETTQGNYTVTYVNGTLTIKGLPVELHVAVTEDGTIVNGDADLRSEEPANYTVDVGSSGVTAGGLAESTNTLFKTEMGDDNRFVGVYYGTTNAEGQVTIGGEVTTIELVKPEGSDTYIPCVNGDPATPLSDYQVYILYSELPKIYYVAANSSGALTKRDAVTLNGSSVNMGNADETAAAQGTVLKVGADAAYTVAEGAGTADFHVPTTLDGTTQASLNFIAFGAGAADKTSTNALDGVTLGNSIQLKIVDLVLKWSVDGETWSTFTSKPAVYAIYKDGHDLTINATSRASADDKETDTFTVTIRSENLVDGVEYAISGYTDETVTPVNGVITLTLKSGDSVTIQSLQDDGTHPYVVKQTPNAEDAEDYEQEVLVDGHTPLSTGDDGSVSIFLERDRVVDFTNTKSYTVSFVDDKGNPIMVDDGNGKEVPLEKTVPYGTKPSEFMNDVVDPTKPMDETAIYRFDDWGPAIEQVGSNTTYTASYNEIKIPSATQRTDDVTNLVVTLDGPGSQPTPDELKKREEALTNALAAAGIDINDPGYSEEAANEILNATDPNGLTRWENLVTGTDTNEPPLSTSVSTDDKKVTVQMAGDPDPDATVDLGYAMFRDLRKYDWETKKWNRVQGPEPAGNPAFKIPLVDAQGKSIGATGLYRVYTLLVPNVYQAITNEIPSTNIIGVLEVNSKLTNTIVAVPWRKLASDPVLATDITVSNHVSPVNLLEGDSVYALQDGDQYKNSKYEMWVLNKGRQWESVTTVSTQPGEANYSVVEKAPDADKKTFPRGNAVWVTRQSPTDGDAAKPFFLVGQYDPAGVEIAVAGGAANAPACTQIAIPDYLGTVSINDLNWGVNPVKNDLITIPNDGTTVILRWVNGKWGEYKQVYNEALGRNRNTFVPYTDPIPVGTGFWYSRRGGAFSITWQPSETVK